jgi:transposase-like protein
MVYLWRAVDAEGEVLDVLVQSKRNKHAALKLMRKLLKKYAFAPDRVVTDDLRSYGSAVRDLGIEALSDQMLAMPSTVVGLGYEQPVPIFQQLA